MGHTLTVGLEMEELIDLEPMTTEKVYSQMYHCYQYKLYFPLNYPYE
jgi:hypothetical protein